MDEGIGKAETAAEMDRSASGVSDDNEFDCNTSTVPSGKMEIGRSGPLRRRFLLFSVSILCTVSSFSGLLDLQSSINISGALGNNALVLMSVSTIVFCLLFTPLVVTKFGAKTTLIMSQGCYLAYVLANFYPTVYTLLPAGILLGIGEALLHTPALMYCTHFGRAISSLKMRSEREVINQYVGYYSGFFQMNEIFGNLISFVILGIGKSLKTGADLSDNFPNQTVSSSITVGPVDSPSTSDATPLTASLNASSIQNPTELFLHLNSTVLPNSDNLQLPFLSNYVEKNSSQTPLAHPFLTEYSMCAANDCYVESEFEAVIDHYVPLSSTAFYIMIAVFSFIGISAIPMMMSVPKLPTYLPVVNQDFDDEEDEKKEQKMSAVQLVWTNFRDTLCHLVDFQQLLMTPLTIYHGLYISFISSEINRAYVSCTIGVEMVGVGMVAGGIMNVAVSFVFGAIAGRKSLKRLLFLMAAAVDLSLYAFCLRWEPTDDTVWIAYIICMLFGATDGVWTPFLDCKYAKYFSKKEEIAYSVHNIYTCVGYAMTYGWTALLCTREKLYIQISVLILGVISCFGAELLEQKKTIR